MNRRQGVPSVTILGLVCAFGLAACKTTQPSVVSVDKTRGEVELYSSGDPRTTLDAGGKEEQMREMESALKKQLRAHRDDLPTMQSLAEVEVALGELDAAEKNCHTILRKDQTSKTARKTLAEIALRRGSYDLAAIFLNGAGGTSSRDSGVLNMLALIELQRGNNSAAMGLFKQALKVNSADLAVRMNLGVLLLKYRQLDQAAVEFERILKSVPNHSDAKLHLAIIKSARGQHEEAEAMLKEVLTGDEKNPLALYNLAVIERDGGKYEEALDNLKSYLKNTRGRPGDTDQVFALISDIQKEQAAKGQKVSDEDIQSMALAAKAAPAPKQKVARGDTPTAKHAAAPEAAAVPPPATQVAPEATDFPASDTATGSEPEEIGDLEKALKN